MEQLFRQEAMAFQHRATAGSVRLATPTGFRWIVLLLAAALVGVIAFAVSGSYARKATVPGVLDTDVAIKRIVSPNAAVIGEMRVNEGQTVEAGETVALLHLSSVLSPAERAAKLKEYELQLEAVSGQIQHLEQQRRSERRRLEQQAAHLKRAVVEHRRMIQLESQKRDEREAARDAALPLYQQGYITRLEWARLSEAWLEAEQRLTQLAAEQAARQSEQSGNRAALEQLDERFGADRLALVSQASTLRQQIADLASSEYVELVSPAAGVVARTYLEAGQPVSAEQPVVSVRPANATFEARLFVPSRAAGFVAPGQRVNVLYDAFPHQQFGTFGGTLTHISQHALMPGVDASTSNSEPVFEAIVTLDRPYVHAYGNRIDLRQGMTLSADIVLERRSLLAWLLEPLHVLRGRT